MIYTAEIKPNPKMLPRVCDFVEIPYDHYNLASLKRMMDQCKAEVSRAAHFVAECKTTATTKKYRGQLEKGIKAPHWFLAGGALASLMQKSDPKDFDLFFSTSDFPEALWHAGYDKSTKWSVTHDKTQFVHAFTGQPKQVVQNFDFVHCQFYADSTNPTVLLGTYESVERVKCRQLVYLGSAFPIRAFMRMKKFIERGWSIDQDNYDKLVADLGCVNIDKIAFTGVGETLKEQVESSGDS